MNTPKKKEQLSFAGILKLLYSNRKSGVLKVQSAEGELLIHFKEGKIVGVEMPRGQEWIIGQYLTEGEVLSERRLLKALKISTQKRLSPEEILVNKRYISPDVLKRYMDLYSREVILPLFGKVGLVCSFSSDEPVENVWLPPVSVPYLLKEGERRAKEWPLLSKRIPSPAVVYGKDKSFISQVVKEGEDEGNPLFSDKVDPELGANERIVYYFVDGKKTVKQLARTGGLDLFSTYKALYNLENKFMVKVLKTEGVEGRPESSVVPYLVKGFFYVVILVALGLLGLNRPGPLKVAAGERTIDLDTLKETKILADVSAAENVLEAAFLEKLTCPDGTGRLEKLSGLAPGSLAGRKFECDPAMGYRFGNSPTDSRLPVKKKEQAPPAEEE